MGQTVASLQIELLMATGQAVSDLIRFGGVVDKQSADAIKSLDRIDAAMKGVGDMSGPTAAMVKFAEVSAKSAISASRELARVEKAGESMAASLDRQLSVFGKTSAEIRQMKAETAALAAEQAGMSELAARIRVKEQELWDAEFAAARRARQEVEAAAQDRDAAAAAATREAQAIREAADAERLFEAVARQRLTTYREQQAAEKASNREAAAAQMRSEAAATAQLATEHARLAATVRGSHDAQEADARAAERLRETTDPLYAATKRLNAEIEESTRLYRVGATPSAEYARQQEVLTGRLNALGEAHDDLGKRVGKSGYIMTQFSFQLNDVATMAAMGAKPMQIVASQAGQIFQLAQMAEGGVRGFATQVGSLALRFAPFIAATAVAGVALYRWHEQLNDGKPMKTYAEGLGLTHKEMKKLADQAVTTGDMVAGLWKTITDGTGMSGKGKSILDYFFAPDDMKQVETLVAQVYGVFVGGYNAIVQLWSQISTSVTAYVSAAAAVVANFFKPVVDAAKWAGQGVQRIFSALYDIVAGWMKSLGDWVAPILKAVGLDSAANAVQSSGSKIGKVFGGAYSKAVEQATSGMDGFLAKVGQNATAAAEQRLKKKADEIKADRTPKVDHHAEQLAREAEAIEAQIRNLYSLADAYNVSGAAALIAEARVKAESQAIKQRGDIEAFVDRQVRLAVAQRVSDAAKSTAAMVNQAAAQERVNAMVAVGLVPAERAAKLVQDQIADLPLLDAIGAAQQRGLAKEAVRATEELERQRAARKRLNDAEIQRQFDAEMAAGRDQIALLEAELRLIGATDAARVHELATLKAMQDNEAKSRTGASAAQYLAQQVELADTQMKLSKEQNAYNELLDETVNRWSAIQDAGRSAADGIDSAFGKVGTTISSLLTTLIGYGAQQAQIAHDEQQRLRAIDATTAKGAKAQAAIKREYAIRTAAVQVAAYGDMAHAAQSFFEKGSTGYKVLGEAEKVFRAIQFALSVKAMIQDIAETGSKLATSAARTAAGAVEAVVNAIKSLPFPANIAAGAATVAALAAVGVSIVGSFGGGKNTLPKANDGTGTVFGDASSKSESIQRSIDMLKDVDDATLTVSRGMLASLRTIENSISGLSTLLIRAGNINASDGVEEGFKANAVGSILSKIPLIGGILGGLFGTKTTVIGSGLAGGPQSVGDILSGGFDASYFSDVEKKKKLFGLTTSTKYSTSYTGADPTIENQFTLLIKQFYDAIGQAAGPLGASLDEVRDKLLGFTVDIGKLDLQGLSGEEIEKKLEAVFGRAADEMATAAFPSIQRFQRVGEGAFETLVRVSSTVEQVDAVFQRLGVTTGSMGVDIDMAIAGMFDSVSDFTSAANSYFEAFYTDAERNAAKTEQMARAFTSLGLAMPDTLAGFRQLVEAQDLTSAAGQQMYATLLQLAPAFAELKGAMQGAASAAAIMREREDLQNKLLELTGDTVAIRAAELAKLDPSNRALQQQIYAIQDAQDAAKAAQALREAWASVGDGILDEVNRIRGLSGVTGGGTFASLLGQFNAANDAARAGDQDAAKSLPGLSKTLLDAAAKAATSRQELDRIQAATAASLEATYGVVTALAKGGDTSGTSTTSDLGMALTSSQSAPANDTAAAINELREESAQMRKDFTAALATIASNTGRAAKTLENASPDGDAIKVRAA